MNEWFKNQEGDVTHWCLGVPTNKEVIDRYSKTGQFGNIKHKDTSTKLSMWFHPATLQENQDRREAGLPQQYICKACTKVKPDTAEFVQMGEQ